MLKTKDISLGGLKFCAFQIQNFISPLQNIVHFSFKLRVHENGAPFLSVHFVTKTFMTRKNIGCPTQIA